MNLKFPCYRICFLFLSILITGLACRQKMAGEKQVRLYNEPHRPQYHFSPPAKWMNDPNGMVYYEGEYHLFYQYYPDGNTWGPMHWGHAVSEDMVKWKHLPIALFPDPLGYIFSGSAVVDWKNTSGLGKDGRPAMVAIYTYHSPESEKSGSNTFQNQGIAYSLDKGRTWQKYEGNPVLKNPGIRDFRDPKVIWHEASQTWMMALAVKDKISFYTSTNLLQWKHSADFNPPWAAYGGVWECPDFFPLKTPTGAEKWVLLVSINPGAPNGGSGTQYFIGNFDGKRFRTETNEIKWLDYGADNYAGVTWSDVPKTDGRRLFIGWMSNWTYAQIVPTEVWRSAMTVPRALELQERDGQYSLVSKPVRELQVLRSKVVQVKSSRINLPSDCLDIELSAVATDFKLTFSNEKGEKVILEKKGDEITFDRSRSGIAAFSSDFKQIHRAPAQNLVIKNIRVFLDRSSMEFFFNDGALAVTELVFPNSPYTLLETEGIVEKGTLYPLRSVWEGK
ncbi:MAG: glycoside hydrolase family 32 protein [Saprospiraceae bacterium]|nr:glycoside hydrolase family 32 protein [Saprospiraceae bacterium]